ncbi:uncharacterized protein LOC119549604 isoform X2 [Drosophila subpulchrella]|uniref:uncharacterized protein LOC119549604 isoform X2 n=1 Tax=Drosophila subpulchrella TaxID=1486046 RepID=UPI0018A15996|nr:uncharacterized protein LOC119549604 isoform X2 [Drosophila subpulchrella]
MSRNRRRSSSVPSDEDQTTPAVQKGSSQTTLRSRSLSRQDLLVQASSIYENETQTDLPQMVDVAVGTSARTPSSIILDWSTSRTSLRRSHWNTGDLPLRTFPHILVEAPEGDEPKDTNPPASAPLEPISEVPYVEPTFEKPLSFIERPPSVKRTPASIEPDRNSSDSSVPSSFAQSTIAQESRLKFVSVVSVESVTSISATEQYDREEPLITKTQKFFKKRAPLVPRYDSEDSYVIDKDVIQQDASVSATSAGYPLADTESPGSFSEYDEDRRKNSVLFDSISDDSKESFDLIRGGRRLGSGMVFIYMVIPPDGGFGWVIMVLSFLAQLIIDGLIFTIGTLLPFIAKDLDAKMTEVLFVASVQIGFYFTSGIFGAIMINRFGFRKVAIAGVLSSSSMVLIASFSVNLVMLICFYSVLGGICMSMIWASSQLIVGYYFERYRPMATGFSCSGGGVGIVVFTFLNGWLVPIIGWRNMLRTQSALIMLILLIAITYVEVAPTQVGLYHHPDLLESSSEEYYGNFYVQDYLRMSTQTATSRSVLSTYEPEEKKRGCAKFCPCCAKCCEKKRKKAETEEERNLLIRPAPMERDDLFYTGPAEYEQPHSKEHLEGKEIHLHKNTQQVNYGIKTIHVDDKDEPSTSRVSHRRWAKGPETPKKKQGRCMATLVKLFDYHLLKRFEFQVLVASAFLYPLGFNIPYVYSFARTTIPMEYGRLIGPTIGITNVILRNVCGFLAYKRRDWTTGICGAGMVYGGCAVFISAFYGQDLIWFQFLYGISYGVAPAVFATLRGLIYVKYLGLAKLTNAFGITSLAMGVGAFIGTTIGGELIATTGNYISAFVFAGLCLIGSGVLKLLLPALIKLRNRKAH